MTMTDEFLEQLLNEDESPALDFKRDQYPFDGASDDDKSELLKDILALANAWKPTDAFILIGVEEVRGGRSRVVGLQNHLDDAKLQQFVNSKTNRPVAFSYQAYQIGGIQIGIITIPLQDRPVFLKKDFGKLKKNTVYIRRGSSTCEADPDEVAKMGASAVQAAQPEPVLELQFADIGSHKELGSEILLKSILLEPHLNPTDFKPTPYISPFGRVMDPFGYDSSYYDKLIEYVAESALLNFVGFVIENKSGQVARKVQLKAIAPIQVGVRLLDEKHTPVRPVSSLLDQIYQPPVVISDFLQRPDPRVANYSDHWELTVAFGNILPMSKIWSTGVVYIGGNKSQIVQFEAALYAENLSNTIRVPLIVKIEANRQAMEISDVKRMETHRVTS